MISVEGVQSTTTKPAQDNSNTLLLQRKCACGGAAGLTGECTECQKKKLLGKPLQTKLRINEPGDEYEQEADRVAEEVMRMSDRGQLTERSQFSRLPLVQRRAVGSTGGMAEARPIVHEVLASPGHPLDATARAFFASRFDHDFANVRVHADAKAAKSTAGVNARAYTIENDIVFGEGQYDSVTANGRKLIAHELTHVVQQSMSADRKIQRAEMAIDSLNVAVNFDHLEVVADAEIAGQLLSMIQSWIGPDLAESFQAEIDALSPDSRRWTMFAIRLLMDNTKERMSGELEADLVRLFEYAPRAQQSPSSDESFVREVLRVTSRLETAAISNILVPKQRTKKKIKKIVEPRASKDLDIDELKRRLVPALEYFLNKKDPKNWEGQQGTRPLAVFQSLGDIILKEARTFFSPYADATPSNIFTQTPSWRGSTHIYEVEDKPATNEDLVVLLLNRAEWVGRNTDPDDSDFNDTNIFRDVSFDDNRVADMDALNKIVEELLGKEGIQGIVKRYDKVLGEQAQSEIGPRIGLASKFDATKYLSACDGHWKGIDTLCHEMVHAMVDPRFKAAVKRVSFDQLIKEGFTEVLGAQFYNDHIIPKAKADAEFKLAIEAGVPGAPCPDPATATIDYGAAGRAAEEIRQLVGDNNFRAAYFLGKPDLAGLPSSTNPDADRPE